MISVLDALKTIEARTDITIFYDSESYSYGSYSQALSDIKENYPHILKKGVVEIQSKDFKEIHIITYKGDN